MIPLLVVGGPTASGKTRLAIELARALGGEIVCGDSMQVYRGMEIATAAPTQEELAAAPHHLFGILDPGEPFSVARYVELAGSVIREIHRRGKLPVLCGGTGLYIHSLIDNIRFAEMASDPDYRRELHQLAQVQGPETVWQILRDCDPDLAGTLHPNNLGRIIRALEVHRSSGVPMSEWQRRSRLEPSPYQVCFLALGWEDRDKLYARINRRVEGMLAAGLLEEARAFFAREDAVTAAQAIGYKELRDHLEGRVPLEEAVEQLRRQTRRYAKRQMTWLRRDDRIRWLWADHCKDNNQLLAHALDAVRNSGILENTP